MSTCRSIMASPYAGSLRRLPVDARTTGPMLVLRRRTADAHRALEDQLDLLSPDLDGDRYADVLVMMAAVYAPLERAIAAALPSPTAAVVGLARRRKVPALRADLAALGRPFPPPVARPPDRGTRRRRSARCTSPRGRRSVARSIADHVATVLGAPTPLAFFRAYGADVPLRWSQFRAAARALLTTGADIDAAADDGRRGVRHVRQGGAVTQTWSAPVDLDNCAAEPIHIPGAIQPHGVLLAVTEPALEVVVASANVAAWFGVRSTARSVRHSAHVIGADNRAAIDAARTGDWVQRRDDVELWLDGRPLVATLHRADGRCW